ncbi:MAG: peptidase prolyl oligopeptidase active site protein [Patescibacteria group bacterium]|nr:peptidase prolyl oligopeptidase active site protein [Patescibacteria group bacterium]
MYFKKYFLFAIALTVAAFIIPNITRAAGLWYGSILNISGDTAILEYRGLETKHYATCSVATLACQELPSEPTLPDSLLGPNPYKISFPSNALRENVSNTGRFGFYMSDNAKTKIRTMTLIDAKAKKNYSVTDSLDFWNLVDEQPRVSRFASDDSSMLYASDRGGFVSLYLAKLKTPSKTAFTGTKITAGVTIGSFAYQDANTILYVANTTANPYNWVLYSYKISSAEKKTLAQGLTFDTTLYVVGNKVAFTRLTNLGTEPATVDLDSGDVSAFNSGIAAPADDISISYSYQKIAGAATVTMKSKTPTSGPHPLIIWLHGGPYRQASFKRHTYISYGVYDWTLEQAVRAGATVVKIDYAGSYGNGRAWTERIKAAAGLRDVSDVMGVIAAVTAKTKYDGTYLVGNSYGGYLGLRAAAGNASKISGVLSINGVTDWPMLLEFYQDSIFNSFFNGTLNAKNKSLFAQASIIDRAKNLTMPITIVQGSRDTTIPPVQATTLKSVLDRLGKNSNLISIEGENHVFLKDSSINTICNALFSLAKMDAGPLCNLDN